METICNGFSQIKLQLKALKIVYIHLKKAQIKIDYEIR